MNRPVQRADRIAEPSSITLVVFEILTESDVISCRSALTGTNDKMALPARMREFTQTLEAGGMQVNFGPGPVGHGGVPELAEGRASLSAFIVRPFVAQI